MQRLPKILFLVALVLALGVACDDDDDDDPTGPGPSGLQGTWVGTAYFGIAGVPQPITIVIDSPGSTFGGTVSTANVPDGPIQRGAWDGTVAEWQTEEASITARWQARLVNGELVGSVLTGELSFEATRQ